MVRECTVILNNKAVTVVDFNGKEIQLPATNSNEKKLTVLYENGKYSVVTKDYLEAEDSMKNDNDEKPVKKINKKKKKQLKDEQESSIDK